MSNDTGTNENDRAHVRPDIGEGTQGIADKALAAGRDAGTAAMDLARSSAETLKSQASQLNGVVQDVASEAGQRLQDKVAEQKSVGADYVNDLADTIRRAAGEFDASAPLAATYIRKAAEHVDGAGRALREGNLADLVQGATSFARNQPTAFLALAALAGFGVVRFIKSAPGQASSQGVGSAMRAG